MLTQQDRDFGALIGRITRHENLTREESRNAFRLLLANGTGEMQQGAFLAALTTKGETAEEVAGAWEAIYADDTHKVKLSPSMDLVDNSGTGMDTFKTFNISTAASLIAAASGVPMARHGARAITSPCGTVDMAEALGVDVECEVDLVAESIRQAGVGLFNGMSPQVHPGGLGRILSKICFGSTLNIAASLANPALPKLAVRGVYSPEMVQPVAEVMRAIGYRRALVLYGGIDGSELGMDECSVCGTTRGAELHENGEIRDFRFRPEQCDLALHEPDGLAPMEDREAEARSLVALLRGTLPGARTDAALLNAGLILYLAGTASSVGAGVAHAEQSIREGAAYHTLEKWVTHQNRAPEQGLARLRSLH